MRSSPPDRRSVLLAGAACLGRPLAAQPDAPRADDAVKARTTIRLHGPDGVGGVQFSPGREVVALFQDGDADDGVLVRLWDVTAQAWRGMLGGRNDYSHRPSALFAVADGGRSVVFWSGKGAGACVAWDVARAAVGPAFAEPAGDERNGDRAAAASPDGERVATVRCGTEGGGRVRLWEVATGAQLWAFDGPGGTQLAQAAAFSPDGRVLAVGTEDGKVRVLDAKAGKEVGVLNVGKERVIWLEWTADGKRLATLPRSRPNRVTVWEVATGKAADTFGPFDSWVGALSPDGKMLANSARTDEFPSVEVWSASADKPGVVLRVAGRVDEPEWSADGRSLFVFRQRRKTVDLLTFEIADLLPAR